MSDLMSRFTADLREKQLVALGPPRRPAHELLFLRDHPERFQVGAGIPDQNEMLIVI